MNKEEFELHRNVIDYLMFHECSFKQAVSILNYSIKSETSIMEVYYKLHIEDKFKE